LYSFKKTISVRRVVIKKEIKEKISILFLIEDCFDGRNTGDIFRMLKCCKRRLKGISDVITG